jgi:hypothetical protein
MTSETRMIIRIRAYLSSLIIFLESGMGFLNVYFLIYAIFWICKYDESDYG